MTPIHLTDPERAALTLVRARAMPEGRFVTTRHNDAPVALVSRPGPMLFDDVPPWMYALSEMPEPIMALPRRRAVLVWVILGAAFVAALVIGGVVVVKVVFHG